MENIEHKTGLPELVWDWFKFHYLNPCGETPEEKEYMQGVHREVIMSNLRDGSVRNGLLEYQKKLLRKAGLYDYDE